MRQWHTYCKLNFHMYLIYFIFTNLCRVWFNNSWYVFYDSSWHFQEPYFSRKHLFHESNWMNRTQMYRVQFVFRDSSWHFHEPYLSRKHIFHKSNWIDRTQMYRNLCCNVLNKIFKRHFANYISKSFSTQNNSKAFHLYSFSVKFDFIIVIPG